MHVTLVGAGALGRVYGCRLAASGVDVSFVVRPTRLDETTPFATERVNGARERDALDAPHRVATIPEMTHAVLVTVRFDQLRGELERMLAAAPRVPIVFLTPLLPAERRALDEALGRPIVPAMPGVFGYEDERGVVRYWILSAASTIIEEGESPEARNQRGELARHLHRAGIPTRVEKDVASMNAATTTLFFPLIAAIDAGGSIDGALGDKDLLEATFGAAKESEKLAHKLGRTLPATGILMRFVGPFTLKAGIALARKLSPEAVTFVETHFGAKLHGQHVAMGEAILALGREHDVAMPGLTELLAIAKARGGA